MGQYNANWEDEEHNRIVELSVEYQLENDRIELTEVTPSKVTFLDPATKTPTRHIGVHTNSGRRMLLMAYLNKVGMPALQEEVNESLLAAR